MPTRALDDLTPRAPLVFDAEAADADELPLLLLVPDEVAEEDVAEALAALIGAEDGEVEARMLEISAGTLRSLFGVNLPSDPRVPGLPANTSRE